MSLQKGLVGHWTMNSEDTDNGKIRDRSAYDNHGTLNGGVTTGNPSPVGESYGFDGNDDTITIDGYKGITGQKKRTTNLWFKSSVKQDHALVSWGSDGSGSKITIRVHSNEELRVENSGGQKYTGGFNITDGNWHMLTVILPPGSTDVQDHKLYVDGNRASSTGGGNQSLDTGSNKDVIIGQSHFFSHPYTDGFISDLRLYDRALSQSEINQLYNKRTTVGGAVQGITAEVYDTQSYYNSNSHPSNKSGLDQFFDSSNSGVAFEKARVHNRPHIFFGNSSQNAGIGNVNSYPYYITTGDKNGYAWKIESSFVAPETGTYTFGVDSDDASDVLIDGNVVASYYGGHGFSGGVSNHTGTVSLTQGNQYDFAARFEEGGGGDGIAVAWQKPSDSSLSKFPLGILTPIQT